MEGSQALAMLDQAIWTRSDEIVAEVATSASKIKIAGFTVEEDKEVLDRKTSDARAMRRASFQELRQRAGIFKKTLTHNGLEPIAILPAPVWERLCQEAQLYRFENIGQDSTTWCKEPFSELALNSILFALQAAAITAAQAIHDKFNLLGFVIGMATYAALFGCIHRIDTKGTQEQRNSTAYDMLLFALLGAPSAVAIQFGGTYSTPNHILSGIAGFLGSCLLVLMACAAMEDTIPALAKCFFRPLLRIAPEKWMHRALWPDRIDKPANIEKGTRSAQVEVSFPEPPAAAADALRKARSLNLKTCVAAESDAITVNRESLLSGIEDNLLKDPIIYVTDGGLVAVLAQFGAFPLEEETIKKISGVDFIS